MATTSAIILFVTFIGAVIQGSVGFGFALLVVPTLVLLSPEALPATVLFLGIPMTSIIAFRERRSLDLPGVVWVFAGYLAGTLGGVAILVALPVDYLSVLFGSLVLAAVGFSGLARGLELANRTRLAGGVAAGVMGTAAGLGGPPLAFVYQNSPGPKLRATLSLTFAPGALISLAGLALAGKLQESQLILALQLLPGLLLGVWISRRVAALLDGRWLRTAVLVFAAASGCTAILMGFVR